MDFIHFGRRMEIERLYLEWCEGEGIANEPNSFVVFLMSKGWLNERKIIEDLKDRKDEPNSSEKPNNCEHITEDGVTCAKYPACDDCLDNPLNKVKGSERLVKGKDEPTISKMEQVDKDINVRSKDEPQTCSVNGRPYDCGNCEYFRCTADEPQTERSE